MTISHETSLLHNARPAETVRLWHARLPRSETLALAIWITLFCNAAFWQQAIEGAGGLSPRTLPFLGSLFLIVLLVVHLCIILLDWPVIARAALGSLVIVSAVTAWFERAFGVVVDEAMLRNVIETDQREVLELMSGGLLLQTFLTGVVPLVLIAGWWPRKRLSWRLVGRKGAWIAGTVAAVLLIVAVLSQQYVPFLRNHRELRHVLTPTNLMGALWKLADSPASGPMEPIGTSARVRVIAGGRPKLLVLLVGETARTANFQLGGYGRETNPELIPRDDVLFYPNVSACGTSTATSLPCMFSDLGRDAFSSRKAKRREGLLDVLRRAGYQVLWRDNNSGCKGVCDRVEFEDVSRSTVAGICADDECLDAILLEGLQERIDAAPSDLVVVLHQKGSHGPAYYRRYPAEMQVFTPTCRNADLARCSEQEIVNSYDNSIRYTDHVLASTIALLEANSSRFDTAMLYLSDHGESLGENGVYLHGLPYIIAPDTQTRVPMIAWFSPGFLGRQRLDEASLRAARTGALSHDSLFHSVLGLLEVETPEYRPELDAFGSSRQPLPPTVSRGAGA